MNIKPVGQKKKRKNDVVLKFFKWPGGHIGFMVHKNV